MTQSRSCPKCSGRMEVGYVLDQTHGGYAPPTWLPGPPIKSFWSGLKIGGLRRIPVTTHRCTSCGFLESYAIPGPAGK